MEINGTVRIGGVSVAAGDVVAADEAGVVFVPYEHVELVLKEAERIDGGDRKQKVDIANGIDLTTLAQTKYK
jgi:4-hydroxy-4-methyl-2-oxoglutarate aldolase